MTSMRTRPLSVALAAGVRAGVPTNPPPLGGVRASGAEGPRAWPRSVSRVSFVADQRKRHVRRRRSLKPEESARKKIDEQLAAAGWAVQDVAAMNVHGAQGVAVREFPLVKGYGTADYVLYVDGQVVGVIEAKKEGTPLAGVELQAAELTVAAHAVDVAILDEGCADETVERVSVFFAEAFAFPLQRGRWFGGIQLETF